MRKIKKDEISKALLNIKNTAFKSDSGITVVPYEVVKKTLSDLICGKFKEKNKTINHPKQLNLMHRHQVINGCKVTIYDDRAEIIDIFTCNRTVIYKNKYKTLDGFKRAIIGKTLKIWVDNY